jgi:CsbD-like.
VVVAADEKGQAKAEQAKGKVKKVAGGAVGNESLKAEGHAEESKGDLRAAKEKAKDAIKPK